MVTRVLEFETRLVVGETPILTRWLPLEHPDFATVVFLHFEAVEVVADAAGDHLQHFRVHVVEVFPPVFQVGEHILHRGVG